MSQSQQLHRPGTDDPAEAADTPDATDAGAVLEALDDPDCRTILEATSAESLTASELSETCDLPLSTTYRKIDTLTEVSLLRESIRLHRSGKHVNQYSRNVEDITISVQDDGSLDISVSHTIAPKRSFPPRLSTG